MLFKNQSIMKNFIVLIVFLLIISVSVSGQQTVEYDFKTKVLSPVNPIKIGDNCVFRIKNINKSLYDVKIKSSQSEFYSKPSKVLSTIFQFEKIDSNFKFLSLDNDELELFCISKIGGKGTYKAEGEFVSKDVVRKIYNDARSVYDAFYKLEEGKKIKNKLIELNNSEGLTYEMVLESIKKLPIDNYLSNQFELIKLYNDSYSNFRSNFEAILTVYDMKSITYLEVELMNLNKKFSGTNYDKLFEDINHLYIKLKNENNYFIASDPVQAKADFINYQIIISPKEGIDSSLVSENRNFNIEVPVYGGVKIDFSTGFFVTNNLYDRKYSVGSFPSDSTMSIISEDRNNSIAQFSLGALVHVSKRCRGSFKPGLTFGLGLNSTDLTNLQAFFGLSVMFGSNEKFIISSGVSLANVDYLKGKYSLGKSYSGLTNDTDLTEKVIKGGYFISFTYNITNKRGDK